MSVRLTPLVLSLAAAAAVLPAASPAQAATCRPATDLLSRTPVSRALPGGAVMRTWDNGLAGDANQRAVVVRVPAGSPLKGYVATAGALTRSTTVGSVAARSVRPVVTINGAIFDAAKGAIPVQSVTLGGRAVKGSTLLEGVIAIGPDRRPDMDRVHLTGVVAARGTYWAVTGLNWGALTGTGINVYTPDWGTAARPFGTVDVVVAGGKVVARRAGTSRGLAPKPGEVILTGTGTAGTRLSALQVGERVGVSYRNVSEAGKTIVEAIGRGRRYLLGDKVDGGDCNARDEQLRPRSAIGWTPSGDVLVVTFSGRSVKSGVMFGGSTTHAMPTYLRQLGAERAVGLDGGGSTTMFVRGLSGPAYRVDRLSDVQRKVPNMLTWF